MTSSTSYLARHHLSWCKMLNFLINLLDLKSLCKWTFWSWPSKIEKMCLLYEWCSSSHKKFSIFIIDSLTVWISNQTSLFMTITLSISDATCEFVLFLNILLYPWMKMWQKSLWPKLSIWKTWQYFPNSTSHFFLDGKSSCRFNFAIFLPFSAGLSAINPSLNGMILAF